MASQIPSVVFNNGESYPILGLGTWKSAPGQVAQAVKDAIDAGYRHFDCAIEYGNEKEVGDGIKQKINEGVVKREDLFVTSKLWNNCHRPDLVEKSLRKSLSNLGLVYLNLYLIHHPEAYKVLLDTISRKEGKYQVKCGLGAVEQNVENISEVTNILILVWKILYGQREILREGDEEFPKDANGSLIHSDVPFTETWKAMEKMVEQGLVKSIGLANFNSEQISEILSIAKIRPVVDQVECHPYLNQKKLKDFVESKGILLTAYSPLGSPDRPWATKDELPLLEDPKIKRIAEKHKKSAAQILIKYQVQRGIIVIPKSVTKERIISNSQVFDFTLDDSDMAEINSLNKNFRYCDFARDKHHKYYPFHIEY